MITMPPAPKRPSTCIKVWDFAFALQDERHTRLGTGILHASRVARLNRAVGSYDDGDWDADGGEDGKGEVFSGGTAMGDFQF